MDKIYEPKPGTAETHHPDARTLPSVADPWPTANPCLIRLQYGGTFDSVHRGRIAVADTDRVLTGIGSIEDEIFPHSALKPLLAAALIETGAARHYNLSFPHLALAAGSPCGTTAQVEMLKDWLGRLGLEADALECGVTQPLNLQIANDLMRRRTPFTVFHNNNAGRHLAALAIAGHLGFARHGYVSHDHPVQDVIRGVLSQYVLIKVHGTPDRPQEKCGMPAYSTALRELAAAMARFGAAAWEDEHSTAGRILHAMHTYAELVSGPGRMSTRVVQLSRGRVFVKGGSEGVYAVTVPSQRMGIAIKIDDGSQRAADAALIAVLTQLRLLDASQLQKSFRNSCIVHDFRGGILGKLEWAL